jgi:hypothetical protein
MRLNDIDWSTDITGMELTYEESNESIPRFFRTNNKRIVTKTDDLLVPNSEFPEFDYSFEISFTA